MIFKTFYPASKKLLLDSVSELDIFKHFCPNFNRVGEHFVSPILIGGRPNKGQKAARILFTGKRFILHDFRAGQSFGAIEFASIMTGFSTEDTIKYLCDLFGITEDTFFDRKLIPRLINKEELENATQPRRSINIDVKYTPWTRESLLYWYQFGWLPYMLDLAHIYPISNFWIRMGNEYKSSYNSTYLRGLSFSYDFGEYSGIFRRKIYSPLTEIKELKWKNNSTKEIIQGLHTIDCHLDTFYLTSSLKDCGPFWRLKGYPCAGAPNSETSLLSPNQVRYIRQISDRHVIYYDNDWVGIQQAKKQANLYGFEIQYNPIGSPKDPSDYWLKRGGNELNKLIL
jgi:hypothetical protein